MEIKFLITEENLGIIIANFMIQNNLTKLSIFTKLNCNYTIDFDMIGG